MTTHGGEPPKRDEKPTGDASPVGWREVHVTSYNIFGILLATVLAVFAIATVNRVITTNAAIKTANNRYNECSAAVEKFRKASDELTLQSRMFVYTGRGQHLDAYLEELLKYRHRDEALESLTSRLNGTSAQQALYSASLLSDSLSERELYAMRLAADGYGTSPLPDTLARVELKGEDAALTAEEKRSHASDMLSEMSYNAEKNLITSTTEECEANLLDTLQNAEQANSELLDGQLSWLTFFVLALLAIIAVLVFLNLRLVILPMTGYAKRIRAGEPLEPTGASELRYMANSYNQMYEETMHTTELLKREAEVDALTGLYNRGSYDRLLGAKGNKTLLLVDVDNFKGVNDKYGHETGDAVLKFVARTLSEPFRADDYVCRIGGDEFAVIMTDITQARRDVVEKRIEEVRALLALGETGIPKVTLSIGVAFSGQSSSYEELYRMADKALYKVKNCGRNGYAFHESSER